MKHPSRASMIEAQKQLEAPFRADSNFFAELAAQSEVDQQEEMEKQKEDHAKAADGLAIPVAAAFCLALLVIAVIVKFPLAHWVAA